MILNADETRVPRNDGDSTVTMAQLDTVRQNKLMKINDLLRIACYFRATAHTAVAKMHRWTRDSTKPRNHLFVALQVAQIARDKWLEIGVFLEYSMNELNEYEHRDRSLYRRFLRLLTDWTRREENPTVRTLVSACTKAGVGGEVRRQLQWFD